MLNKIPNRFVLVSTEELHNRFTHYLLTSAQRTRARFIQEKGKRAQEIPLSSFDIPIDLDRAPSMFATNSEEPAIQWNAILNELDSQKLYSLLSELPEEEAKLIFYHAVLDMSYKDIAKRLGVETSEVESRYFIVIRRLRIKLQRGDDDGFPSTSHRSKRRKPRGL